MLLSFLNKVRGILICWAVYMYMSMYVCGLYIRDYTVRPSIHPSRREWAFCLRGPLGVYNVTHQHQFVLPWTSSWVYGGLSAPCGRLGRPRPSGLAGIRGPLWPSDGMSPPLAQSVVFLTIFLEAESPAPLPVGPVGPAAAFLCGRRPWCPGAFSHSHVPEVPPSRAAHTGLPSPAAGKRRPV